MILIPRLSSSASFYIMYFMLSGISSAQIEPYVRDCSVIRLQADFMTTISMKPHFIVVLLLVIIVNM